MLEANPKRENREALMDQLYAPLPWDREGRVYPDQAERERARFAEAMSKG